MYSANTTSSSQQYAQAHAQAQAQAGMKRKAETPGVPPPSRPGMPVVQRPAHPPTTVAPPTAVMNTAAQGRTYIPPSVAVTQAVQLAMQQQTAAGPSAKMYPATEIPFTGNFLPLPAAIKVIHPKKVSAADYSVASSPVLPPMEMYDIAFSLSIHTGKTIVLDYWAESLSRDQKIMVVEVMDSNPNAKKNFILMKSRHEFTSPIVEYHEICYYIPSMKDGKTTNAGACAYIFLTQNSIYLVKHPVKLGRITMEEFERRNRDIDAQES